MTKDNDYHLSPTPCFVMFPDLENLNMDPPIKLEKIEWETQDLGFNMASLHETGSLLRTLAASKPGANILELGTGTGIGTCWLLDGMDEAARLTTVDNDQAVVEVAQRNLGDDHRLTFICEDGSSFLKNTDLQFDIIFADAWPGKFSHLDEALSLLAAGGIYVVDDLLPQESWPEGHAPRVPAFINELRSKPELDVEYRAWASGILIAGKYY